MFSLFSVDVNFTWQRSLNTYLLFRFHFQVSKNLQIAIKFTVENNLDGNL